MLLLRIALANEFLPVVTLCYYILDIVIDHFQVNMERSIDFSSFLNYRFIDFLGSATRSDRSCGRRFDGWRTHTSRGSSSSNRPWNTVPR